MSEAKHITVEMIGAGAVLVWFPLAFATHKDSSDRKRLSGEIALSIESLSVAEELRDALSAFITVQRSMGI